MGTLPKSWLRTTRARHPCICHYGARYFWEGVLTGHAWPATGRPSGPQLPTCSPFLILLPLPPQAWVSPLAGFAGAHGTLVTSWPKPAAPTASAQRTPTAGDPASFPGLAPWEASLVGSRPGRGLPQPRGPGQHPPGWGWGKTPSPEGDRDRHLLSLR